jgi:hypothetical protein
MEQEQTLNPNESLALITETISKTKEDIRQHSFNFLLWGWLLIAAVAARYLIQNFTDSQHFFVPFPITGALGITLTALFYWRKQLKGTQTYLSYFILRLWMVLTLGFVAVVIASVSQTIQPAPYIMIISGMGTLITGIVIRFRSLQIGGVIFLACAIFSSFLPNDYKDLVHGLAIIPGFLIPGYLLKNSKA